MVIDIPSNGNSFSHAGDSTMKCPAPFAARSAVSLLLLGLAASVQAQALAIGSPLTNYAESPLPAGPLKLALEPSSYTFAFSNGGYAPPQITTRVGGAVGAMNAAGITIQPIGAVTIAESYTPSVRRPLNIRYGVTLTGAVNALQINPGTQNVDELSLQNGVSLNTAYTTEDQVSVAEALTITNMRANLRTGVVTADLSFKSTNTQTGQDFLPELAYVAKDVPLWQASVLSAPAPLKPDSLNALLDGDASFVSAEGYSLTGFENTPIPEPIGYVSAPTYNPYYVSYGYGSPYPTGYEQVPVYGKAVNAHLSRTIALGGLHLTEVGREFMTTSFSSPAGFELYAAADSIDASPEGWGAITATLNISAYVPEPSTYLMMGLGLVGISLVQRQRKVANKAA
jgi:PEP-CTERM motif